MAKKKVRARTARLTTGANSEPIEFKLDLESLSEYEIEDNMDEDDGSPIIKEITITPVGFPIKVNEAVEANSIKIENEKLFQNEEKLIFYRLISS